MSLLGKISLGLSVVSFIIITTVMFVLGGWLPVLYIFFVLFILGIALSLIIDHKVYLSLLLMRTTKNGMSMGISLLIGLVFFTALAYLSLRFEKSIDITEEKINSLSPQTTQILDNLKTDMRVTVFYKGGLGKQKKEIIKKNFFLFKKRSRKIKDYYYDVHLKNKLAQEYLNELSNKDKEDIFVFMEYKGKKVLVAPPFDEEQITTAIIKATRREENTIYFLSGHKERELSEKSGVGISELGAALADSSFKVKTWNFVTDGLLPEDVSLLIIAGPDIPFLEKEIHWLEQYLQKGGKMILALDPDKKHNLKMFLKKFGVDYRSRYILDVVAGSLGLGKLSTIGIYYDTSSPVTKSFRARLMSIFYITSDLKTIPGSEAFSFTELVRTDARTVSVSDVKKNLEEGETSSHTVALLVEENKAHKKTDETKKNEVKKSGKEGKSSSMKLAVFGDSDFLSNELINIRGINRDLILNTISYLVDELDLVSIRPKRFKPTKLILKTFDKKATLAYAVVLPILFFIFSFIIWFRRNRS